MGLISNGNAYHGGGGIYDILISTELSQTPDDLHSVRWRGVSPAILACLRIVESWTVSLAGVHVGQKRACGSVPITAAVLLGCKPNWSQEKGLA